MDTTGYITIVEVIFLFAMIVIAITIAGFSGLYRAVELQNNVTAVVEDLAIVQATIDTIQTVNLAQINFSFNSLRSSVYGNGLYNPPEYDIFDPSTYLTINDWALCTSYPFPSGNPPDHQVDPLGILPPWKNSSVQKERCDILYAKTALDLAENNN
jgi:hypothetical protein